MEIILLFANILAASVVCSPVAKEGMDLSNKTTDVQELTIVSREGWNARKPKRTDQLSMPVPYVIIHHTYIPGACVTSAHCVKAMQGMQNYHMDDQGWNDIGYNFCVGGDSKVYVGRGWKTLGAHAAGSNSVSIGICLIGDWTKELPPESQMNVAKRLIGLGVTLGHISERFTLLGHRQVRNTECPGDALFNEIRTWKNFSDNSASQRGVLPFAPKYKT